MPDAKVKLLGSIKTNKQIRKRRIIITVIIMIKILQSIKTPLL